MVHDKAEQLQFLLDVTAEQINELSLTVEKQQLSSIEIFQEAVSEAINQYLFITTKKPKLVTIGRVDTTKMAFCLQDTETVAVIQGDLEFAEDLELDFIESIEAEDENDDP